MYHVRCEVCNDFVESEYWDDVEQHIEACYARRSPRWQGRLEAFSEEELNASCQIIRCEAAAFQGSLILDDQPLPKPEAS